MLFSRSRFASIRAKSLSCNSSRKAGTFHRIHHGALRRRDVNASTCVSARNVQSHIEYDASLREFISRVRRVVAHRAGFATVCRLYPRAVPRAREMPCVRDAGETAPWCPCLRASGEQVASRENVIATCRIRASHEIMVGRGRRGSRDGDSDGDNDGGRRIIISFKQFASMLISCRTGRDHSIARAGRAPLDRRATARRSRIARPEIIVGRRIILDG